MLKIKQQPRIHRIGSACCSQQLFGHEKLFYVCSNVLSKNPRLNDFSDKRALNVLSRVSGVKLSGHIIALPPLTAGFLTDSKKPPSYSSDVSMTRLTRSIYTNISKRTNVHQSCSIKQRMSTNLHHLHVLPTCLWWLKWPSEIFHSVSLVLPPSLLCASFSFRFLSPSALFLLPALLVFCAPKSRQIVVGKPIRTNLKKSRVKNRH